MSYEPVPVPRGLLELEGVVEELPPARGWLGVSVAPNESESLEELEVRPGVRVLTVTPGSPAETAGVRPGDVLLAFGETPVNDPGRLESLLLGIEEPVAVALRLERGSRVFELEAGIQVIQAPGVGRTLYHIDRVLVRAAFRDTRREGAFPVVARLARDSPLLEAGVEEGDRVVAFQGRDPGSAAELVRRFATELEPGGRGVLRIRKPGGPTSEVRFRAWDPGRNLTSFRLWPIYSWDFEPVEKREQLMVGDLILLSLFKKVRLGNETRYSILSLIKWETGEPLLESSIYTGRGPGGGDR